MTEHEHAYPETIEGNWKCFGKCPICGQLPPFEYIKKFLK